MNPEKPNADGCLDQFAQDSARKKLVLVIEDEAPIRRFLKITLEDHGYQFAEAMTGEEGLATAALINPDLVILDLGLPDMDGLAVTKNLREWTAVPILVLSARGQEQDKVNALDFGADDYLTKPFGVGELLARIRVALRRLPSAQQVQEQTTLEFGEIKVDLVHRRVFASGEEIHLTPIEYRLLTALCKYQDKVLTHNHLLKEVWGLEYEKESHYLRVYMAQLRRKLEADAAHPRHLITEPGVGYRLKS